MASAVVASFFGACLAAPIAAASPPPPEAAEHAAMLFLDSSRLASWSGVTLRLGEVHLLSEYRDPSSFVGWGYPSAWRKADGSGWRMMYQGWHLTAIVLFGLFSPCRKIGRANERMITRRDRKQTGTRTALSYAFRHSVAHQRQ